MSGRDPALILSPMQFSTAVYATQYLSNEEIARELSIASRTVKYHLDVARRKLRVKTKRDLARVMAEWGYTEID